MLRRLKFISAESISKLKFMWPTPNISLCQKESVLFNPFKFKTLEGRYNSLT
jgi:hypothetical protein